MNATTLVTRALPFLALGGSAAAGWVLFLHLMQSNQAFAEAVGAVAPSVANQFSCGCPLCNPRAQCSQSMGELSLNRLDGNGLNDLFRGLPVSAPR
ncbi:MAG: hypothetical protein INF43_01475 [Alphaproteobacteria bacterium]|nr:hypothetical protein [Alphaproteobacteria bacterium]